MPIGDNGMTLLGVIWALDFILKSVFKFLPTLTGLLIILIGCYGDKEVVESKLIY